MPRPSSEAIAQREEDHRAPTAGVSCWRHCLVRHPRFLTFSCSEAGIANAPQSPTGPVSVIPELKPEFFQSPFFRRFHIQRELISSLPNLCSKPLFNPSHSIDCTIFAGPIIDPEEYTCRYNAWLQHQHQNFSHKAYQSSAQAPLTDAGQVIAKVLVTWAASYGVDEKGQEAPENSDIDVEKRSIRVKEMIDEILSIIDMMGLLRRPSWDGVRVILLTLPLAESESKPMLPNDTQALIHVIPIVAAAMAEINRLAMYEAAIQQVYTLCQHDGIVTNGSPDIRAATTLMRARIFWYAYVHEGLTTGLRGGRLLLGRFSRLCLIDILEFFADGPLPYQDDDDLKAFQKQLPKLIRGADLQALARTNISMSHAYQYATAPIRLANACRLVHAAVTGPKARRARFVDEKKLNAAWESLAQSWEEFESLRTMQRAGVVGSEESIRFVDGWQVRSLLSK